MINHEFDIVDCHQHYESGIGLKAALNFGGDAEGESPGQDLEFETRIKVMDDFKIAGAIMLAGNSYLRPNGLSDTAEVNNKLATYRDRAPDRILGICGLAEPVYGPANFAELRRCKEELGMTGIVFHNGLQASPLDSPLMFQLIEQIGNNGMVPFVHALGNQLESIWQVDLLAKAFPDLPFIVLDVFHDISQVKSLPDIAERRPNLYFDMSLCIAFDVMCVPLINMLGAERFVFGTNFYSLPTMKVPLGRPLEQLLEANLATSDKAAILGGNIRKILDLPKV